MKQIIKITAWLLITFALLLGGANAYLYFNGKEIKKLLIGQLNEHLNSPIHVGGEIKLTLWDNFPYISMVFPHIQIRESYPESKENLLVAEEFSLLFNVWDLINKNYRIKKTLIKNGGVYIKLNEKGIGNYLIIKQDTNSGNDSDIRFALSHVKLEDIKVRFSDFRNQKNNVPAQDYLGLVHEATLSGNFSKTLIHLDINGKIASENILINGNNYLDKQELVIKTKLNIYPEQNNIQIASSGIQINKNNIVIDGQIDYSDNTTLDLHLNSNNLSVAETNQLLKNINLDFLEGIPVEGQLASRVTLKGILSPDQLPHINATFELRDGRFTDFAPSFKGLSFKGRYDNGRLRNMISSSLSLNDISFNLGNERITGYLSIDNLATPVVNMKIDGSLDIEELARFSENKNYVFKEGKVTLKNLEAKTRLKKFDQPQSLPLLTLTGNMKLENISFSYLPSYHFEHLNGTFGLNENQAELRDFAGKINDNQLELNVHINNLIPYITDVINGKTKRSRLFIEGDVLAHNLNMNSFSAPADSSVSDENSAIDIFPEDFTFKILAELKSFQYNRFNATNVKSEVTYNGNMYDFKDLAMNTMEGRISLKGKLARHGGNASRLTGNAEIKQVQIKQLFYQFDDFYQSTITHENLAGKLTGSFQLNNVILNQLLELEIDPTDLIADIRIENGQITGYKPLESLSSFTNISDLRDVRFSDLENRIEIRNQKIFIPHTDIQSNAYNLSLSGTHGFDNSIDYKVFVKLSDYFARNPKLSKFFTSKYAEDQQSGYAAKIPLKITGTVDYPEYSYDFETVGKIIKENIEKEKTTIKTLLRDEIKGKKKKKKIKDFEIEEDEIEFLDFPEQKDSIAASKYPPQQ